MLSTRACIVGFGQDLAIFTAWSVIPVWAKVEAHASPGQLGALPVLGGVVYVITSMLAGRLSDRVSRTTLARVGLFLFTVFCLLAWRARSVEWIYLVAPVGGIANALIWPGLQALIGDESGPGDLEKNLGIFSLAWSAGKTLGFFVGGLAWEHLGLGALPVCGAISLLLVFVTPSRPRPAPAAAAPLVSRTGPPAGVRAAYLRAAWIANFAAYALGATLNFLYEDLVVTLRRPEVHYNYVLAALFLSQTVSFWFFGKFSAWRYRPGAFLFWQAAGAASLLVIGFAAPLHFALAAAVTAGAGLGLTYAASIYYSVHSDAARGQRAGIHEAVIGASNFVVPMAGGWFQQASGWAPAPYVLAATLVAGAILVEIVILRGARNR